MEKLLIATGKSRFEKKWKNIEISWDDLLARIGKTFRSRETVAEYAKMKKPDQDAIKDIGGFVGGHLKEGKRRNGNVAYRTLLTLDADFATPSFWDDLVMFNEYRCAIYSTHKHTKDHPRLRLIIPLDRKVSPDEYEAIARRIAYEIGIDQFDDTTYQATRLMYWPSTSSDGQFVCESQEGHVLSADAVLAKYHDWKDISYWPQSSRVAQLHVSSMKKQEDPLAKTGTIGAFCRAYSIAQAIETFLSDKYEACDVDNRYTYKQGTSSAGLIVYDDKFAYSNHSTDPASMQLCNAFDLVRIHLFGDLDDNTDTELPANKKPSFVKMNEMVLADESIRELMTKERLMSASEDFEGVVIPEDTDWMKKLTRSKRGDQIEPTIENVLIILRNDPALANLGGSNEFNYRNETFGKLPWDDTKEPRPWTDTDDAGIRYYIEKCYNINGIKKIEDALALRFSETKYHPVREYLEPLKWDGTNRLDRLMIEYLGADDSEYTRAVTRKTFCAAVARVYRPGVKFDYMLTMTGAQGLGKSTLIKKMAKHWFSDSLISIGTKEAYESLHGVWLLELAELTATKKAEVEAVKQFISKQEDVYRRAYGHNTSYHPRQCIFFGSTNDYEFLRDSTGNRRFWPILTSKERKVKSVFEDLTDDLIDQLWAEAKHYYDNGEELFLSESLEAEAYKRQEEHSEHNAKAGLISVYLDRLLPSNWDDMGIEERKSFIKGDQFIEAKGTVKRTRICALEIFQECFAGNPKDLTPQLTKEINSIMAGMSGWKRYEKPMRFKLHGLQRGFTRDQEDDF
jgi:predicted P-loop ATPase